MDPAARGSGGGPATVVLVVLAVRVVQPTAHAWLFKLGGDVEAVCAVSLFSPTRRPPCLGLKRMHAFLRRISMPNKCCATGYRRNFKTTEKVYVCKFPQNADLRQAWTRAIPRENLESQHTRVRTLSRFDLLSLLHSFSRFPSSSEFSSNDLHWLASCRASLKNGSMCSKAVSSMWLCLTAYVENLRCDWYLACL